jgi:hypothetical protein
MRELYMEKAKSVLSFLPAETATEILSPISTFLSEPRSLAITVRADQGIAIADLLESFEKLKITATANKQSESNYNNITNVIIGGSQIFGPLAKFAQALTLKPPGAQSSPDSDNTSETTVATKTSLPQIEDRSDVVVCEIMVSGNLYITKDSSCQLTINGPTLTFEGAGHTLVVTKETNKLGNGVFDNNTDLGSLLGEGACWHNDIARICAHKLD